MLCLRVFRYKISVFRFIAALKDFGYSLVYYFGKIFDHEFDVTVTDLPSFEVLRYLPYDIDGFFRKLREMWAYVFDIEYFIGYIGELFSTFYDISVLILLLLPLVLLSPILLRILILKENDKIHGSKSRAVVFFEKYILHPVLWIKDFIACIFSFFWEKRYYKILFVTIWLLNFNLLTIAFEFFAWYFYFAFSFNVINIPIQIFKLFFDLFIFFSSAPIVFWIVFSYIVVRIVRKNIGYQRLDFRENLDRAFIDRQPLLMMFTGSIGTGKTTALTSFILSLEIKFRNKALELMLELDSKYPNFPWINLEDDLRAAIELGIVKNLTTCRDFIAARKALFLETLSSADIFDYDVDVYRYSIDDNLSCKDIWDTLSDYACLYFIYIIQSSLIVSNYSVRSDNYFCDCGNFPVWDTELFRNSSEASEERSRRSHILDYDVLRLGRQVLADNPRRDSFEFGIVALSEFAKERGNQITLQEVKKGDGDTNQKNDLCGYGMKMSRHKATVCGFPFIVFVADEQRPSSLGADIRDLMSIIHIESKEPTELLMPMYFVEELIHDIVYPWWKSFYTEYRLYRGDVCLPVYVLHNIVSLIHLDYKKTYNLFGCNVLNVAVEDGTLEGEKKKERIHLLHKKVYSNRFATDSHYGFFVPGLRETESSFEDYMEYSDTVASVEELLYQNSYFIKDMQKVNLRSEKND